MSEKYETEDLKTPEERLTEQFYQWERRGRGWKVFPYPVPLEPPFRPFPGHFLMSTERHADDGRKHTWASGLIERLLVRARPTAPGPEADYLAGLLAEPEPEPFEDEPQIEFEVTPSRDFVAKREEAEAFLLALSAARFPISFEILGNHRIARVLFAARESDSSILQDQLRAFFSDASIKERDESRSSEWLEDMDTEAVVVEFGLLREFMLPLRSPRYLDPDPLISIFGAMGSLREREKAMLQVLLAPAQSSWSESVMRAVTDGEGGPFFSDAPALVKQAEEKISRPLYAVILRAAARSPDDESSWEIVRRLSGAVAQFGTPDGNEFIPLSEEGDHDLEEDLLRRQTHRTGMLLSTEELVPLVHLPGSSVRFLALAREEVLQKLPPAVTRRDGVILGENLHGSERIPVRLPTDLRMRHTHILGTSGSGKSTLLLSLILQDIARGDGVAVLDPHGDLIEEVLARVPEERIPDVVLLDPSDEDFPVGVNVLHARSERERILLASDLVAIFRRLSTTWGDQMHSVLANAIQAFLESDRGGTLVDLRRFLVEENFREEFLDTVRDPEVVYYFRREFRLLVGRPQGPILTRLDSFLRPRPIRNMVAQREDRIDFREIVDGGKILLAKLAMGAIGEENAALLGSLFVAKLNQVAMSREDLRPEARRPFHLVIDEFQHFVTPSMATLLSSARKYRVGLTLAHQELRQVESRDRDVLSAVLANAATRIVFRVGDDDAKKLEGGFDSFEASDLKNLGVGEAICRVERAEGDFNLTTSPMGAVEHEAAVARRARIVALTRERYARARAEVERELRESLTAGSFEPATSSRSQRRKEEPTRREMPEALPQPLTFPERPRPAEPPPLGRGGPQHKYLQELVKRWAEGHGYRATIEKQILDGLGSVDVALEREGFSFACEISVASTAEQELGNVQKCLAAEFDEVAVLSLEKKGLPRLKELILASLEEKDRPRVLFATPEELFSHLETRSEAPAGKEATVGGYKVRVAYRPATGAEEKTRARAISEVILKSLRRMKEG